MPPHSIGKTGSGISVPIKIPGALVFVELNVNQGGAWTLTKNKLASCLAKNFPNRWPWGSARWPSAVGPFVRNKKATALLPSGGRCGGEGGAVCVGEAYWSVGTRVRSAPTNTPSATRKNRDFHTLGFPTVRVRVLSLVRRGKTTRASGEVGARHIRTRRRVDGAHTGGSAATPRRPPNASGADRGRGKATITDARGSDTTQTLPDEAVT